MPKANNRNIYEERPWLNDDVQNRTVLRQIVDGGGSNITVEEITITENDTYTAPAGKAYSPVIVNVAGGSSDFSTATVTLINNSSAGGFTVDPDYYDPRLRPNAQIIEDGFFAESHYYVESAEANKTILYMGDYFFCGFYDLGGNMASVSGNAEIVTIQGEEPFDIIKATGDCTLTISDANNG